MIAFVCDQQGCETQQEVHPSTVQLPKGWLEIKATDSQGLSNNPSKTMHFCPKCSSAIKGGMPALRSIGS